MSKFPAVKQIKIVIGVCLVISLGAMIWAVLSDPLPPTNRQNPLSLGGNSWKAEQSFEVASGVGKDRGAKGTEAGAEQRIEQFKVYYKLLLAESMEVRNVADCKGASDASGEKLFCTRHVRWTDIVALAHDVTMEQEAEALGVSSERRNIWVKEVQGEFSLQGSPILLANYFDALLWAKAQGMDVQRMESKKDEQLAAFFTLSQKRLKEVALLQSGVWVDGVHEKGWSQKVAGFEHKMKAQDVEVITNAYMLKHVSILKSLMIERPSSSSTGEEVKMKDYVLLRESVRALGEVHYAKWSATVMGRGKGV